MNERTNKPYEREERILIAGSDENMVEVLYDIFSSKGDFPEDNLERYVNNNQDVISEENARELEGMVDNFDPSHAILTSSKETLIGEIIESSSYSNICVYSFNNPDNGNKRYETINKRNPYKDYVKFIEWIENTSK